MVYKSQCKQQIITQFDSHFFQHQVRSAKEKDKCHSMAEARNFLNWGKLYAHANQKQWQSQGSPSQINGVLAISVHAQAHNCGLAASMVGAT
jgi:hypothetical protein